MHIVIDANALGHAFHRATTLTVGPHQVQAVFGYIRMLRNLKVTQPSAALTVLWDGYAQHRFALLPDYKGDRERMEQTDPETAQVRAAYRAQVPIIKKIVELLGVRQIVHPDYEADDLAGAMCAVASGPIRLVTGDGDWLQLVSPLVDWHDPRNDGKLVTHKTFHQSTGYHTPEEFLHGKALIGDTSDSIPGLDGFGEKTASALLAQWHSVDRFLEAVDKGEYVPASRKSKTAKSLHPEQLLASEEGRLIFRRNMELMDLRKPKPGIGKGLQVTQSPLNREGFVTLCARLNFASVTRDVDSWLLPFTQQQLPLPIAA